MKKTLFLHKPKTAGSYICNRIRTASRLEHNKHIMWLDGWQYRGEDWDHDCLESLCHLEIPKVQPIVHVHTVACDMNRFLKFKHNGWFSFMFHREPLDTLTSALMYFEKKLASKDNIIILQGMNELLKSLILKPNFPWRLPLYYKDIDWVRRPTEENFIELFDILNIDYTPCEKINTSDNKGYQYYRDNGFISDETHEIIINTDDFKIQQELWETIK